MGFTPGAAGEHSRVDSSQDGLLRPDEEGLRLSGPEDVHTVVQHAPDETHHHDHVESAISQSACMDGVDFSHVNLLSHTPEQLGREQRVLQLSKRIPDADTNKTANPQHYRSNRARVRPRIRPPAKVDAQQEQHAAGHEEEHADVVELRQKLQPRLAVPAVLHLKVGRAVEEEQQHEGGVVEGEEVPIRAAPADVLVGDEGVADERGGEGEGEGDVEAADGLDAVAVGHALLDAGVAELLEAGADAEEGAGDNHLVDGAGGGTDEGADDGDGGAGHHEVAPAEDVGEAAADGDEYGGAEGPGDGDPGRVRGGPEVGVDVGEGCGGDEHCHYVGVDLAA